MTTVRLPPEMEKKIAQIAQRKKKSKSEIIKEAIEQFLLIVESEQDSYSLGVDLFGKYGSGDGTLSTTYKEKIKSKLNDRYRSY